MSSNIWYLFVLGLWFGSGPCLTLCAPVLMGYAASRQQSFKKSLLAYCLFSLNRLVSYVILGLIAVLGIKLLYSQWLSSYFTIIHYSLGGLIIIIGVSTIFYKEKKPSRLCSWIRKTEIGNVAVLGLLIGLSPCVPLLGSVIPYIVVVSNSLWDGFIYTLSFGLGTVFSPLLLLMMFSGKAARRLRENCVATKYLRIICGLIIVALGVITILSKTIW